MGRRARNGPTSAELEILGVLWERGPSTVREVHEALSGSRDVGYTTVLKQMQIMVAKGRLRREDQGRAHVYRPADAETASKREIVGDLMDRAFGGSAQELVLHALAAKPATPQELLEIRRLLDELEARTNGLARDDEATNGG